MLVWHRAKDDSDEGVVFLLLEDRDPHDTEIGALCLVLDGEVYAAGPGSLVRLRGLCDGADLVAAGGRRPEL